MRSIHKKTLKRFLSTLLAVVMVLGMVPFTALAAPSSMVGTYTDSEVKVTVTPNPDANLAVAGNDSVQVPATVTIELLSDNTKNKYCWLRVALDSSDPDAKQFIVAFNTDSSGDITFENPYFAPAISSPSNNCSFSGRTITVKCMLPVKYGANTFVHKIWLSNERASSTYTLPAPTTGYLLSDVSMTGTSVTVPRKADLTVTAAPSTVTAGEDFTVTAESDINNGYIEFTYNGVSVTETVMPRSGGKGYATHTFTAVTGQTSVTAKQFGMSGGVVDSDVKNTTITVGAADTYYDVTFLPGAADAYIPFSPTTVSVKSGESYTLPTAIPTREGYTFKGWDSNGVDTTVEYPYNGSAYTTPAVAPAADMTLNAVWEETKYPINYRKDSPSAADYTTPKTAAAAVGETVYFGVTVPDGYDASTMCVVVENTIVLAPYNSISGTGNTTYYYSFVLTQNMASGGPVDVVFTGPSKLTYTVMMPVGHFTAKITTANGATVADPGASASVEYGKGYTFTVTPASGYEIKGVYVNGAQKTAETDGSYKVENVTSAQTVEVVVDAIPSYTVTYVVNDAQYTTQKVTSGSTIGTLPDDPVVDGYTFDSWNTKQNGSGTKLAATTTVSQDMTVYAQLTANTYTITYDENGGSGEPPAQTKTHGTAVALSTTVPTRTGYTFLGWGTSATATAASYQPGDVYSTDAAVTLYAVWQIDTFTVTLPNGTGYSISTTQSTTVEHGKDFVFTVKVDRDYSTEAPVVKWTKADGTGGATLTNPTTSPNYVANADGSKSYTYTIENIQENKVVSVSVTKNSVYTVTFQYTIGSETTTYQTQQVEHGAKATVPNPPSVEGYTFDGWYKEAAFTNAFNFADPITGNTTVYGKMTPITPKVSWIDSGTGWTLGVTESTPTGLTSGGTVTYKSDVKFTVTIAAGYDATNLAVAANGLALAPVEVNGNTYKFVLSNITADQNITVVGVARKMITITYNDNGGIGGPGQEQVVYYLSNTDCGEISLVEPTRVGYTFLGWAKADTNGDIPTTPAYSNPAKTNPATSKIADFTTDTTLYAVWSAKTTTVTLTVDKTSQYEVENVVLTAEVKSGTTAVTSGSVQFYRTNNSGTDELIGTAKVSGGKAVLTIATSAYKHGTVNTDSYTVKFIPDEGSGYSEATSSPAVTVTVLSTAISWKLNGENIDTDANVLTIKDSNGDPATSMIAGQVYTLELPAIYALDAQSTALVVNKDYKVTWQFCNASGTWEDYTAAAGTDSVKILAEYSQYVFRAVVTPLTGATGHFTKAAKYTDAGALTADSYVESLVTKATNPVAQQDTATTLAVSDTHDLTGGTVAEFEGQKVTLTATVTLFGSTTKVTTGEVYFYNGATLTGKANVQSDGTAVLEATMSTYSAGASDVFKAVYQENATYNTSTSNPGVEVVIRSTAIAWAGSKALNVTPIGSIYADNQYTLALPTHAIVEDGQSTVTLIVGTDYVVSWYMVEADNTVVLLAENTESNTYTVVPPTAGVTYYAVVSPKAGSNYTDAYEDGETKNFLTSDKTAASVKAPTITTITFGDVKTDTGKTPDFSQYEEKTITITAKVVEADLTNTTTAKTPEEVVKSGTVTFYVVTKNDGTYEKIGTATVSNGLATVSYKLPEYDLADGLKNIEYFFAVYSDTAGTYADSNTTSETTIGATQTTDKIDGETEAVQILSTSISWKLDVTNKIVAASATTTDANKLTIYVGTDTTGTTTDKMTAGSTYTLELPAVYALDDAQNATNPLAVNKDYKVTWQYRETDVADWQDYTSQTGGDTVLITPDYSGYQFQAVVTPIYDNAALTGYKTAAQYDNTDKVNGKTSSLVTDPTEKTVVQHTTTDLAITGADNEKADVKINGATPFTTIVDHKAQFEGQKVTLEATVTDNATSTGVTVGYVNFYRYVESDTDVLLNTTPVKVGANGVATFEVTISTYNTGAAVTANVDRFYAVYLVNDTYDTSASVTKPSTVYDQPGNDDSVWVKSTAIKTPVIDSTLFGKRGSVDNATSTSYTEDLTDLLAGVEHTFTLRTGASTADYSVVALDGRTVAAENYDIQWLVTTGSNEEQAPNDATQASFVVNESKNGDKYRVKLIHKGDMTADAFSNYVVINSLQDVTVLVTASDEIDSTPNTDVYQLNDITLTAEVQGKDSQIMLPTGNVTFYYSVNGTNWVEIGTAALKQDDVSRTMKATFVTDKLPVDVVNGYKQEEVTITAVYAGDETFKASNNRDSSGNVTNDTENNITAGDYVQPDNVTVYSSVVFVSGTDENRAVISTNLTTDGIHIVATGDLKANETGVVLTLQDIYTLDHHIDLSKLTYGTDYTVQWQILENASQYNESGYYGNTVNWADTGVTLKNYTISSVPQDAAYRAKITVTDTAPVQGSAQGVLQAAADDFTTGRQVYYSNVLVVGAGQATVTTNITTSNNTKFNEEGIVEGETVTIHALVAGASNVTPISNLTVTITPKGSSDAVFTDKLTTVNGYNAFTWNTTGVTPGYYTLTVEATSNNGYAPQTITRTLIVRDNTYTLTVTDNSKVYNGKAQGIDWSLTDIDFENAMALNSVVVYYYEKLENGARGMQVEPTQAGDYIYELYLPASAYWTELTHVTGEFTITPRPVNVVDLVAQAKVYDRTTDINELEVILNDSAIDANGVTTGETGIINGDSIYATGVMTINSAEAGTRTLSVSNVTLGGDDANNYTVGSTNYTETINVQRSQVKGDIANSTFKYTGSNITVPADDIYLIDQAGNQLSNYTVTYYYHNGDGVEQVTAMNKLGKYTVIARPEQDNYKGGASETIYVVSGNGTDAAPTAPTSALINITNTVELYGAVGNTGIVATATNSATTTVNYNVSGSWTTTVPSDAGRYLVKVTTDTGDTAYGIYTIVKANPVLTLSAADMVYDSGRYDGTLTLNGTPTGAEVYYTYTGGTIQGIAYEAPTEAGNYVVTAHVGETANYTAHEVSANFTIAKAPLTITADDLARWQYGSFPDMVATFTGLATGGVAADTSLRDVQIQPEFIFNDLNGDGQPEYTNSALDQVGKNYPITVRNALARNYTVTYVAGSYAVNELDPKADLAIHGMIDNGLTPTQNIAYYGDQIQLYAYGNYKSNGDGTGVHNPSSLLEWSLSAGAPATIDQDGLLTITGVGDFTVTLTRGSGTAAISTSIQIEAKKQEVKVIIPEENKVYSGAEQTYTTANGYAVNGKLANVSSDFNYSNTKRTDVGSQIVTGKVLASDLYYQSETYGGLFTINDKEVTVKPTAQTVTYGTDLSIAETAFTVDGKVGSVEPLTNTNVASVRELYNNLDVGTYEILVAGTENQNYNVKYETNPVANKVTVEALALDVSTGTLDANVGMTSGSLNPLGNYPANGAEVASTAALGAANVRMYGEPNWVMDYALTSLIPGDSLADLALDPLAGNLVDFNYTIAANANVKYEDKTAKIESSMTDYNVDTDASMIAFGNYTESYTEGTQNIYQRPVTLALSNGQTTLDIYYSEILTSGGTIDRAKLLNIIINNVEAGKYNDGTNYVGGLAELLKHTVKDLNLQVDVTGYTGTPSTPDYQFTARVTVGNPNYWLGNAGQKFDITVNILLQRLTVDYTTFTATFSDVVLYQQSETTRVAAYATGDVTFIIYRYVDGQENYSYYAANETAVVSKVMTKDTSRTGRYYVTYPKLSAGTYRVFAVASGYTIID